MARILLIDDDEQFRMLLRKMLEKAGYNDIEEANDGSMGVKLFRQHPFDLVITDLIMPDKEGIETIIELTGENPQIKIIAMSGGGRVGPQDYLETAKRLGASRTLAKPFNYSELVDTVHELLSE
ncbi:MAG: response regulator [Syntrophales bacterium]